MKTVAFLKYVYLSLLDKAYFLQFYRLLLTQSLSYNIFLHHADGFTSIDTVIPDNINPESTRLSSTTLHTKMSMKGTIAPSYEDAHNLLTTMTDGY